MKVEYSSAARRALTTALSEAAAAALYAFIEGELAGNPRRVGGPMRPPLQYLHRARRGEYRVVYAIDDARQVIQVVRVEHRRTAYRR